MVALDYPWGIAEYLVCNSVEAVRSKWQLAPGSAQRSSIVYDLSSMSILVGTPTLESPAPHLFCRLFRQSAISVQRLDAAGHVFKTFPLFDWCSPVAHRCVLCCIRGWRSGTGLLIVKIAGGENNTTTGALRKKAGNRRRKALWRSPISGMCVALSV